MPLFHRERLKAISSRPLRGFLHDPVPRLATYVLNACFRLWKQKEAQFIEPAPIRVTGMWPWPQYPQMLGREGQNSIGEQVVLPHVRQLMIFQSRIVKP